MQLLIPILDPAAEKLLALQRVGGIPLLRRQVLLARKAGLEEFHVVLPSQDVEIEAALLGTGASIILRENVQPVMFRGPLLMLAPCWLPSAEWLQQLSHHLPAGRGLHTFGRGSPAFLLMRTDPARLLKSLKDARSASDLLDHLRQGPWNEPAEGCRAIGWTIRSEKDRQQVERQLLQELIKDTEGFMSLHFNRKISLFVSRRLMNTRVSPNQMTWVSLVVGLVGAAALAAPMRAWQITGAALFCLHSILDGCDGELARLKFLESRWGGILDFWGDNVVHVAVFSAIGIAQATETETTGPLWLSALAVFGTLSSASVIFFHTMRGKKEGPLYTSVSHSEDKSALVRIADMLSRRDFIYLVLLLACFAKLHWFLQLTAVGAPAYALVLLYLWARDSVQTRATVISNG